MSNTPVTWHALKLNIPNDRTVAVRVNHNSNLHVHNTKDYSQDCSVYLNLPIACQSTVHHQVLNMANYQEVDLQLAWLICPLAAQNKEKNACQ